MSEPSTARRRLSVGEYVAGVRAGDRTILARAITLIESSHPRHAADAQAVLTQLLPRTGHAMRVGVSGVPGAGKSTFIEALGMILINSGKSVAVLAVDPSSTISGGSILGDKTRMSQLALERRAFIRPSPNAQSLGGVGRRTRETMLLCEAAGFDVVLVETVGVGQSETLVAGMVDFFLVLMIPGAGDELQGIKRGIIELADLIAVNKADGDNVERARVAEREYSAALRHLRARTPEWQPRAMSISAKSGAGLCELWSLVVEHRAALEASGALERLRKDQLGRWMWSLIEERLLGAFSEDVRVRTILGDTERQVHDGAMTPTDAAWRLLRAFGVEPASD